MKKVIIFTLTLAGAVAITPLLLRATKAKDKQKYARASAQHKELSAALKTNKILQMTITRGIKREIKNQDAPAVQKLHRQLKSLRTNEKVLNQGTKNLLRTYPKLKGKK